MARRVERLTAIAVAKRKAPGRYADGGGLYLQVGPTGGKSWLFRFTLRGRAREMGLGAVNAFSLADARARATRCRQLLADGIDPLAARDEAHAARVLEASSARTFDECAAAYIQSHRPGWKNPKHIEQWQNTLSTYCSPVFGALPVQSITTALVIKVLEPVWTTKNETASRLRGRIERVLDWAKARGYIAGDNPARWRGHLDKLLPAPRKVQKVSHHAALPYPQMGGFMREVRSEEGVAARALEFAILTAARTGEVIGAQWDELDFTAKVWTVPAERMKAKREHRVPLSDAALLAIRSVPREGEYVFCGPRPDRPLSNMAMLALLRRMKRDDLTVHGFRSSFRDWAAEVTNFAREVAEAALAHVLSDKTEAAYRRGDLFDKRRKLMQAWADWCDRVVPASVTPIKEARAKRLAKMTVAGSNPGRTKALTEVADAVVKIADEGLTPQHHAMRSRAGLVTSKAVLPSAEATQRLGVTRQALSQAVAARRLFTLEFRGNDYYPAFFADPEQDKRQLEEVAKALGDLPGWSKWQFFTTPKLPLRGKAPLQALKDGKLQVVLRLARGFAES